MPPDTRADRPKVIPCIDLMGGKVVQLVRGREKALEAESPEAMLERFRRFPVVQVIDLDQALGQGSNLPIVRRVAGQARTWVGGGVRTAASARDMINSGAERVIVGTSAFGTDGPDFAFLRRLAGEIGAKRVTLSLDSMKGRIVVKGWREATNLQAERVIAELEPYCGAFLCTYVDNEGTMQGTDLDWYRRLRAATGHEITAAGGIASLAEVEALLDMGVHAALGMAVYSNRLSLNDLADLL